MLMDGKFEYGVPYVRYQLLHKGHEFWEVSTPADLTVNSIKIHHWRVLDEVRFDGFNYIEVKLLEVDDGTYSWERVELIAMGHLLRTHYFETEEEALAFKGWYLEQRKKEGRL